MRKLFKERKLLKGGNYMRKYGIFCLGQSSTSVYTENFYVTWKNTDKLNFCILTFQLDLDMAWRHIQLVNGKLRQDFLWHHKMNLFHLVKTEKTMQSLENKINFNISFSSSNIQFYEARISISPIYRKVASSRPVYYSIFINFWGATNSLCPKVKMKGRK